jgi:hypothetical protein
MTWIDPRCDRSQWPPGEWDHEPDKVQWTDKATGLSCLAKRHPRSGHWCGYVGVSESHPWHGKSYDDLPDYGPSVHGGLTFADSCQEGPPAETICHVPAPGDPEHLWWFGFDCAHCFDQSPEDHVRAREDSFWSLDPTTQYRALWYVRSECGRLAWQIKELRREE